MRVVVVGNGIAATMFAKSLRESDDSVEIDIFAKEKYNYYPRPNLIEFLADRIPFERIFAFPEEWYANNNLNIHLKSPALAVHPESQEVEFEAGKKETHVESKVRKVADVSGAGDTVISTLTAALTAGSTFQEAATIANYAAGIVCEYVGIVPVEHDKLYKVCLGQDI